MDRSDSNSSADEPTTAEKKMRVDKDADAEVVDSTTSVNLEEKVGKSTSSCEGNVTSSDDTAVVPDITPDTTTHDNVEREEIVEDIGEEIELKVVYNKIDLKIKMPIGKTIGDLKLLIEKETKIAPALQKIVLKGIQKDDVTLESLGVTKTTKILVIGTPLNDVLEIAKAPDKETFSAAETQRKEVGNWCTLPQHKKVLDKGIPSDVMPAILNESEPLPEIPLFGMLNSKGGKVRLTFKLETDELWIGTKERTDKIPMGSIRGVETQAIIGYEHYHIVAIQLGPTEASRYFVYWVPCQYTDAIKDALAN